MSDPSRAGPPHAEPPPWKLTDVAALCLLVAGTLVSLLWLVHPYFDYARDGSIYIATARSILAGEGYSFLGHPFILRPPGFPVLLTPVLALAGTSFPVLNLYVSLFGVLCVSLLFCLSRARLGAFLALTVCAAVWINPGFQRLSTQVMADVPGAALMMACLVLERSARRRRSRRRDALLGVLVAAATYVRTINLLLAPAIVISRLVATRGDVRAKRALGETVLVAAIPILALLPWIVRDSVVTVPSPAEQHRPHSYWVAMWHTDIGDPESPLIGVGDMVERVRERTEQVVMVLGSRMGDSGFGVSRAIAGVIALLCGVALWLVRRDTPEMFAGLALLMLIVYFGWRDRLVLPLFLILFPAAVEMLLRGLRATALRRAAPALVAAAVLLLALSDADFRSHWPETEALHRERLELAAYIDSTTAPGVPIAALNGPSFSPYMQRRVYSLRVAMLRMGVARALEIIDEQEVGAVVIEEGTVGSRPLMQRLVPRHGVEKRIGGLAVIRIRGPADG